MFWLIIIVAVAGYFFWKYSKKKKENDDLYEGYVQRTQTAAEKSGRATQLLQNGFTGDKETDAAILEKIAEGRTYKDTHTSLSFNENELRCCKEAAAIAASGLGISNEEAYQMVISVYDSSTVDELRDRARRLRREASAAGMTTGTGWVSSAPNPPGADNRRFKDITLNGFTSDEDADYDIFQDLEQALEETGPMREFMIEQAAGRYAEAENVPKDEAMEFMKYLAGKYTSRDITGICLELHPPTE